MNSKRMRFLVCTLFLALFSMHSYASHMIGGDVTYICKANNNFEFTITLFQDCLYGEPGALAQDNPANYSIFDAGTNAYITGDSVFAISTVVVDPNFSNACINNYPNTCLRKQTFKFTRTLPPNANGYVIVYERCCRNASISNIVSPGNVGVTYFATIPPFQNGQCPNNSAVFTNFPPQIICANNPFVYDFSATDADGDSLSYKLCAARPGGSTSDAKPFGSDMNMPVLPSVVYTPTRSAEVPVPGVPPMQINPITGMLTGTPINTGRYVVSVCVTEWRNGVAINTISRDVQFVITNCSKAVVANIPELDDEPNTFAIECKSFTVKFRNTSTGGFSYHWNFGVGGATSTDFEPTFTYPDTGTYIVSLVVNRGSTCPDSISRLVKIYPQFNVNFDWSGKLCPGEQIQFNDLSTATYLPITSWRWEFGDGSTSTSQNPTHIYPRPGGPKEVTLSARTILGCRDALTKTLPLPVFDPFAGNDTIIVLGYPYTLNGTGSQFYKWSPTDYLSDPNIANPSVTFPDTGRYTYVLTGSTEEGCIASDTIVIWVVSSGNIFVPNAFSPNGDGLNDMIGPRIVGFSKINYFYIFNRFGQKVFSSVNDNYPAWDGRYNGKFSELGSYYYIINVTSADGSKVSKKGDITLIR